MIEVTVYRVLSVLIALAALAWTHTKMHKTSMQAVTSVVLVCISMLVTLAHVRTHTDDAAYGLTCMVALQGFISIFLGLRFIYATVTNACICSIFIVIQIVLDGKG